MRVTKSSPFDSHLLAERVDVGVTRPGTPTGLRVADRLGFLAHRSERLHRPALDGPEGLGVEELEGLGVAPGVVESARAGWRPVEAAALLAVATEGHACDSEQAVGLAAHSC
jgi:hypothetical protein